PSRPTTDHDPTHPSRAPGEGPHVRGGAVAGLLAVTITAIVAVGVLATPQIVRLLVMGYDPARRDLTVSLVRILFPGIGLLVMSAWCLGILNSHRRFFLSYAAPVVWNVAIIATTLLAATRYADGDLVRWTAWGAVLGSALQFAVQLPVVWRLTGGVRWSLGRGLPAVGNVVRNFLPAATSRGVVQISAFADAMIASWLPKGALSALTNAQLLYTLPVSLFGMSIAAAELPALSETAERESDATRSAALRQRIERASRHVAFFVVPSVVAFLALGRLIAALVLQSGRFTEADSVWVWGTLAGATVGLLAATLGRLYSSAFFALRDTRTPLRYAVIRVGLGIALGIGAARWLPGVLDVDPKWGTAGLAAASGLAGWIEFLLLRRALVGRLGPIPADWGHLGRVWLAALLAAAVAWPVAARLPGHWVAELGVVALYGLLYLGGTVLLGVPTMALLRSKFGGGR
ncbi:MAG: murein biosynthesis integral membrane protein MurJ, partial [Gemmatimonadales bacterium]|nr:murein biosynthesis integral membrane protein MurJ [Gemmatimonadales bacterium]